MDAKPVLIVGVVTGASALTTYVFTQNKEKSVIVGGIAAIASILTQVFK